MYCKGSGLIAGALLIIISMWAGLFGLVANKWIVFAIGVILVLHGLACKCRCGCGCACEDCDECKMPVKKGRKR